MANLIAPVTMARPPMPVNLSDWLAPEEPRKTYFGPNIDWSKVPGNILNILATMDPSGMTASPAGLIMKTSSVPSVLGNLLRGRLGQIKQAPLHVLAREKALAGKQLSKYLEEVTKSSRTPKVLGGLDVLKSERGSFSTKPIGKQTVKEHKELLKNKEIMDVIREEIGKVIQKPGRGGVISSKKGGGMIANKPEKLSEYLEDTPKPTKYGPKGERIWEF